MLFYLKQNGCKLTDRACVYFYELVFQLPELKKLSEQKSRKTSEDSLKFVLGAVKFMFGKLNSPRTKKE